MKAWVLDEHEISRKAFLKGGGALVIGVSFIGMPGAARGANNPGATFPRHTGAIPGPTDATQIDLYAAQSSQCHDIFDGVARR